MELPASPQPNGVIITLPNEIFGRILSFSGTRDLLRFRGVNYLWNLIAGSICRRRHVRVTYLATPAILDQKGPRVIRHTDEIDDRQTDDFPDFDLDNLPFSSYTLSDPECISNATQNFLATYGPQLWKFELEENCYDHMVTLLQFTPNIHQLTIEENGTGDDILKDVNLPPHLGLLHLTYLELSNYDMHESSNLELLHFILVQCHAPVKTIKFSLMQASENDVTSVINLIQNMESIHIRLHIEDLTPNFLKLLYQKALPVRGLGIVLDKPRSSSTLAGSLLDYYALAKRVVDKYSSILESLFLECEVDLDQPNVPFKFPILPRLTQLRVHYFLDLIYINPQPNYEIDYTSGFLAELTQQHVPILNQVGIDAMVCCNDEFDTPQSVFSPLHSFPSVKKLNNSFDHQDWNALFPNLEKLTEYVGDWDEDTFRNFFRDHHNLEHLCLHLEISGDINVLLTGIPNPDAIYTKSKDEIDTERARHNLPSLLQFKRLKTLELRHADPRFPARIRDSGVSICLLELKPLEKLTIVGHHISPEWEVKLRRHHHHVILRRLRNDLSSGEDKEDNKNAMEDEENGTNEMVG